MCVRAVKLKKSTTKSHCFRRNDETLQTSCKRSVLQHMSYNRTDNKINLFLHNHSLKRSECLFSLWLNFEQSNNKRISVIFFCLKKFYYYLDSPNGHILQNWTENSFILYNLLHKAFCEILTPPQIPINWNEWVYMNYTCCFNWHKICIYLGDKRLLIPAMLQYFLSNPQRKIN